MRHSWPLAYDNDNDNDANLAGLVIGGTLLRGSRGAAGEMVFLDFTEGVGRTFSLAPLDREWGAEVVSRSLTLPGLLPAPPPAS